MKLECECYTYKRSTADADSKSMTAIHLCHLIAYDLLLINCDNMRVHILFSSVVNHRHFKTKVLVYFRLVCN